MSQLDTFRGFDVHAHPKRAQMIKQHRRLATALVGGLALLTLAACGSNSASGGTNPPAGNASGAPGGGQAGRGGAGQGAGSGFPGVSGLIVALSGKTIQVRTTAGQSAVSFTDKTTVTEQQKAAVSDAKAGLCATVRSSDTASGQSTPSTTITASSVNLSDQVDGSCRGGFGGGFGRNRPQGAPSGMPSGVPSGVMPSGAPGGGFGGASGVITAVTGSAMTIQETRGTETKTTVTVNLTGQTTYTRQAKTTTKAIATGKCVLATGKSDSTGALAATAVRLTTPVNGQCMAGFGRRNASGSQSGG